jgi:hypothetical protein
MSRTSEQTTFEATMQRYVGHQRALGRKYDREAWVLGDLAKHLHRRDESDLDATEFEAWSHAGSGNNPNVY